MLSCGKLKDQVTESKIQRGKIPFCKSHKGKI